MPAQTSEPRIHEGEAFTVVGISMRATQGSDFADLWDRFGERGDEFMPFAISAESFGVEYDFDEESGEFTYLAGVKVSPDAPVPEDATAVTVPAGTFAVFSTTLAEVGETYDRIYEEWLPESDYVRGEGPEYEYYGPTFDPAEPLSKFEIHVPVVEA